MKMSGPLASMAQKGTGTDTMVGHLTPGEVVVPRKVTAEESVMRKLKDAFEQAGLNFPQYVVGSDANRPNPHTGAPMFEGGGDPGEGSSSEGGHGGMGAEGGTAHGDGGNVGDGGQMGAEGGTAHSGDGGNIGGGGQMGAEGGTAHGGGPGGGPGSGGGGNVGEGNYGEGNENAADMPSAGAMEVSGPLSALGLSNVFGGDQDRNAAVDQIGGGPNATPGIGPGSLNEAAANIANTSGGPEQAQANADAIGDPALSAAVAAAIADAQAQAQAQSQSESDAANMPSKNAAPVSAQLTAAQLQALGLDPFGQNTATVNALGPGAIGSIGGTTAFGNTGFGLSGGQGQVSGTIGGSQPGGPNANFGDPGITGLGGSVAEAAAAAQAAADAAIGATGGIAGTAGPDSVGGFGISGVTSNDQTADMSAPFGGQSTGVLGGSQMGPSSKGLGGPSFGMTSATDVFGGAPYSGAEVGFLGTSGVPGTRADARAEQQAQLAAQAQAVAAARSVGSPFVGPALALGQQPPTAMQAPTQQQAQAPAPTQSATPATTVAATTPATSPLAAVSGPQFNAADVAAALASMGSRPSATTDVAQSTSQPASSRGQSNVSFGQAQAGQPSRSASSIAAPEKSGSMFSNAVNSIISNVTDPSKVATAAINTGLGLLSPLSGPAQIASYGLFGQSVGALPVAAVTGQPIAPGGIIGGLLSGGPTAGFNTGPSNPNLSPGGGGEGGGYMGGSDVAGIGPGSASFGNRGTTAAGAIPAAPAGVSLPASTFSRSYQGPPTNATQYGYGPQYAFYAAKGGHVKGPLSMMRRGK